MRLPDKLLRAELSMLQDEIRMAQQMMQNPITATMNAPKGEWLILRPHEGLPAIIGRPRPS